MKVFRHGTFYEYDEIYGDDSWSYEQLLIAASFYAMCRHNALDERLSYSLSYMYVMSESVPELVYEEKFEKIIIQLMNRVETS